MGVAINEQGVQIYLGTTYPTINLIWAINYGEMAKQKPITIKTLKKEMEQDWINSKTYHVLTEDPQESAQRTLEYFFKLFHSWRIVNVSITVENIQNSRKFIDFFGFYQLDQFYVFGMEALKNEELSEIVEKMSKISAVLGFQIPIHPDFSFDDFHHPKQLFHLKERSGSWFTRDILFNCQSPNIRVSGCLFSNITSNNFKDFVIRWCNSKDTNFQSLILSWNGRRGKLNGKPNFEEFGYFKYHENRRHRYVQSRPGHMIDASRGGDIKRNDGLWATILRTELGSLVFYVWHDRFPNFEGFMTEQF